jgi:transposase
VIDQIRKLKNGGHSIKKIAEILKISKNTVRRYLRGGIQVSQAKPTDKDVVPDWMNSIDWEGICAKRKQGYSVKQLYSDYEPAISYNRFGTLLRKTLGKTTEIALRLQHNPGERVQVDFCDGIPITNPKTGKQTKTHLFVGVLPFSSYCFAVFVENQKLPTFIRAHQAMWTYFGGVTPYVVIDNLKAGVKKAHRYDPEINPTYCDYSNHAGFAVLPARPYTPRDKACVEANIGAIQRSFFQSAREKRFYSLRDLNDHFRIFLEEFNKRVMPDYGVSRSQRFEVEKEKLKQITSPVYELCEWREAKVHPDCCIQIGKTFYSVPYQYRHQIVRVKATDHVIEIFNKDVQSIACHQRSHVVGEVVRCNSHFPDRLLQMQSFDIKKSIAKAKSVGPNTELLVDDMLSGPYPLRYLRRTQGMFRLLDDGITPESLEYACSQAITFRKHQLSFIKSCAKNFQLTGGRLQTCRPQRDPSFTYLRGVYKDV